jgi:hypothetical protein
VSVANRARSRRDVPASCACLQLFLGRLDSYWELCSLIVLVVTDAKKMTRYMLIGPEFEARGLSLEEAFARMMAAAGSDYVMSRNKGVMQLFLMRNRLQPDMPHIDFDNKDDREMLRRMWPLFQSDNPDDADARHEIMLEAIKHGRDGYFVKEDHLQAVA